MRGCRPFTEAEVVAVAQAFGGRWRLRNQAYVTTGIGTGFRASELAAMRLGDVVEAGRVVHRVQVRKANMKGKREARTVALHEVVRATLEDWIEELARRGRRDPETYLWLSQKGANRPIDRRTAWRLVHDTARALGWQGPIGTHSMRKTFARRAEVAAKGHLPTVQKLMGHADPKATVAYLASFEEEAWDRLLEIEWGKAA